MSTGIILVDPQYDFFPGGALAVPHGDQIIDPINALLTRFPKAPLFASRDWHPSSTRHFRERGGIWPPHCVQQTRGACFHEGLQMQAAVVFDKGTNPDDDGGYSAFDGRRCDAEGKSVLLIEDLRRGSVDSVVVAGLATDYCVKATALDAVQHGLMVFLFLAGVRAVEIKAGDGAAALEQMRGAGVLLLE